MTMQRNLEFWIHPIRLAGLLSVFFLCGPGSLEGFSLLMVHAGVSPWVPLVPPATHGMLQLTGGFLLLIWGFLTHALVGMMAADPEDVGPIRRPIMALAAVLLVTFALDAFWPEQVARVGIRVAGLLVVLWGTFIIVRAARKAHRPWTERPFPFLVGPLAVVPVVYLGWVVDALGWPVATAANELMLYGVLAPVLMCMGYRMFSAMLAVRRPRERPFDVASVSWVLGAWLKAISNLVPALALPAYGCLLLGAACFLWSVNLLLPSSGLMVRKFDLGQTVLRAYLVFACLAAVLGALLGGLQELTLLPAGSFYWRDVSRHLTAMGFVMMITMGVTQRVLPFFVRGQPSSSRWMLVNFTLVALGVLLRLAEPWLPETRVLVHISATLSYIGILSFGVHLARGLTVIHMNPPSLVITRVPGSAAPPPRNL